MPIRRFEAKGKGQSLRVASLPVHQATNTKVLEDGAENIPGVFEVRGTAWVPPPMAHTAKTHNNSPAMPLIDDKAAAVLLGVAPATLRSWRCRGIGPAYVKLGLGPKAACRYNPIDIESFIAQCRQVPTVRAAWEPHGDL